MTQSSVLDHDSVKTLKLFTTLGCHLCEDAEIILAPMLEQLNYKLEKSESEELVDRYGIRIPVIRLPDDETNVSDEDLELNWPFGESQLHQFLS